MKPLGYEKMINYNYEDLGDIAEYGSPSRKSHLPGKGGDIHNSFHNTKNKAKARRIFKRIQRAKNKKLCEDY